MDQAYNEARLLLPQQSMESDEAYELRLAGTIYEKVLRPVIPGAIKAGRYDALEMMWNSPYLDEAMRADLADTVRSGHYENTLYAFQSPQMSALNDGLVYNLPGTDKQVWANPGMNGYGIDEYLQEDFIQNPDSLFYMTPSRVDAIRQRFLEQSESDLELIRTVGAGAGRNTLPVRSKQLEAMGPEYANTYDPATGWFTNGLGTGMVLAQHGMVSDEVNEILWRQLNNDNQQVQMQAVQAMVFMAAWPDADSQGSAWSEIKRKAMDNPLNEQIVLMVERIASDHAIFPHDVQGTAKVQEVDLNVASDKIYEMIQSNMFQEAPTREQLDRAGQVLGLTNTQMRYSSAQTQAVTEKVVEATKAWMWTQDKGLADGFFNHDLVVDNPYLQRVLSNKYMQFVTQHSGNMNLSDDQIKTKADADFKRYLQGKFDVVGLSNNDTERASLVPLPAGWPEERRWNTNTEARVKKEIDKLDLGWDIERGDSNWDQVDQLVPSLHPEFGWGYLLADQDGMYLTADVNKDGELTPVWINPDVNRIAEADKKALADELRGTRSRDQWKRQAAEGFWSLHPAGVGMRGIMEMMR